MSRADRSGGWALVTGAARRVGAAIARALGEGGTNVALHCHHSIAEAEALAREIRAASSDAIVLRADLSDAAAVRDLASRAEAETGGIDVLVNNASNYLRTPWASLDESAWEESMSVNLKAPYLLSVALGTAMRRRGVGAIVNLVDWSIERPYRDYLPYSVSKAGLVCLTRALARELAPTVRVNAVAPGPVLLPDDAALGEADAVRRATPLGLGTPEAVASAVRFLLTEATFTTGAILHVDGGRSIA